MGQITATRNLVAIKVVRHAGQQWLPLWQAHQGAHRLLHSPNLMALGWSRGRSHGLHLAGIILL